MKILIVATKNCSHHPVLARQLETFGVDYTVKFLEDNPELARLYDIQHSPNLVVDGEVVFRAQAGQSLPAPSELQNIIKKD